ncbi:MAG: alpha/beta hydrolase family protein [Candidatus Helarchaeota archaeon]
MRIKENLLKLKNILLIVGVILIGIGGILTFNFNYVQSPANEFDVELYAIKHPIHDILPVRIDATLYIPKLENDLYSFLPTGRPAVVLVHGYTADKLFFKGLAQEFSRRGFVCLAITSRGHGDSGGLAGLTWENETLTAVDYLEMLADSNFGIDKNRIGLVGHSMGAFSVTLAASMDNRINATVAIGGPMVNITRGFGFASVLSLFNITGGIANLFNLITIQYLMPGLTGMLQYPYPMSLSLQDAVIQDKVNGTNPKNYLNIIGTIDEVFSVYSAQEVLWYMGLKDPPYNVSHYVQVLRNTIYGDFNNGTARKLVTLPETDHITEHSSPACAYEAINWMQKSMKLEHPIYGSMDYLIWQYIFRDSIPETLRSYAPFLVGIGALIAFIPISIYLGNWLKSKYTKAKVAREIENKKMWLMFLIYGVSFCLISLITVPVIQALNIIPWTDYLGFNIIHMLLFVQAVLFLPILIVLIIFQKWKYNESLEDFGLHPKAFPKSALYGFLLFLFIFLMGNLASSLSLYDILPSRPDSFFEILLYMSVVFIVSEVLFRGLIQTKLSRYDNVELKYVSKILPSWKEFLLSSLIAGLIQGIGVGIIGTMFIDSLSLVPGLLTTDFLSILMTGNMPFNVSIPNIPLPLMIVGGSVLFFFLLSLAMSWLYRKSRNVYALIIFGAFLITWISTIITPAIAGCII